MTIDVRIIADSVGPKSKRITTFQLRYPRFIHAELMTHRLFSRNASSSRAIPVKRMIADIIADTAMPIHWGKNQPGMQANEEQDDLLYHEAVSPLDMIDNRFDGVTREAAWCKARDNAIAVAEAFDKAGYHKQIVNRILEPFMHISVVVTATNFDNFFWLRCHADAQPEIKALADAMYAAFQTSKPEMLQPGEWHLPYVHEWEKTAVRPVDLGNGNVGEEPMFDLQDLIKMSVARCARVSYLTHDGREPDFAADIALYDRLVGSAPLHASPAEHQATPDQQVWSSYGMPMWDNAYLSGNFDAGWIQFRQTLPGQFCSEYEGNA